MEPPLVDVEYPARLTLRPATPEDRFLIRRWLAEPRGAETGGADAAGAEAADHAGAWRAPPRCRASSSATARAIGYAHAVEIGVWAEERPDDLPAGTWDIDLFIASAPSIATRAWRRPRWCC